MPSSVKPSPTTPLRFTPWMIGIGFAVLLVGFGVPALTLPTASASVPLTSGSSSEVRSTPALGSALTRLTICLLIILGSGVVLARYFNRSRPEPPKSMAVLAAFKLNSHCAIHLIQANNRRLLVGTDWTGVKALVELPGDVPDRTEVVEPETVLQPNYEQIQVLLTRLRAGNQTANA